MIGVEIQFDLDLVGFQLVAQDLEHVSDGVVDVDPAADDFRLPGEIPDVRDHRRCAAHMGDDVLGHAFHFGVIEGLAAPEHFQDVVGRDLDHAQGLVDFVGHAGRHHPQGGHFTGLDQLGFLLHGRGDVGGGRNQDIAAAVFGAGDVEVHKKRLPAFLILALFRKEDGMPLFKPLKPVADVRVTLFPQREKRKSHQLRFRVAVAVPGGLVGVEDLEGVGADDENRVGVVVEDGAVFFLRLDHLLLEHGVLDRHRDAVADQFQHVAQPRGELLRRAASDADHPERLFFLGADGDVGQRLQPLCFDQPDFIGAA